MKRKLLTVFSILLSLIGILAIFTACNDDEEPANVDTPSDHTVTEEYYYDANGTEYLISLRSENYFTYSIAGDQAEGTYKLENGTLTLTPTEGANLSATVSGNVLNLTYKETPYTFRLKVNYTVHFDAKGGSAVSDGSVLNGKTVAKPQDPTKAGETFVGWYMDEAYHNAFSFSQRVTGDLTLYARFVAPIDPEFTVSFAGEGADDLAPMTTTGGMVFDLPTPQKEGAEFVGWYVSQSGSPTKLSYKYNEQPIEEDITLYAVWDDGAPIVSISDSGVEIENLGVNERYNITIVAPNGSNARKTTSTDKVYAYDFTSAVEGEYTVVVEFIKKKLSTVRYYSNKTLAHVTVFKVTGYTLSFNGVKNATGYILNAVCGSDHTHSNIMIDPDTRSWSFEDESCELPIDFTVTAVADGYVSSVSERYHFTRTLDSVKNLTVSDDTAKVTWGAVENATSYYVSVMKGSEEVLGQNVGNVTTFDLSGLDPDTYTVQVKPVARSWVSPDAASLEYKKARLATPKNFVYRNDTVSWDAVKGAASYTVVIDGVEYKDITGTSITLSGKLKDGQEQHTVVVRALPLEGYTASFDSAEFKLVSALSKPTYKGGILSWNAVEGVNTYVVTVDGESTEVTGNTYKVTFKREGSIFLSVSAVYDDGSQSAPQEISVTVYALTFDMNKEGVKPAATLYLAEGDPYELPDDPEFAGNLFAGWYSAEDGGEQITPDGDKTFGLKQNDTYYAHWNPRTFTITFNTGKYGKMPEGKETYEVVYDARNIELPVPEVTDLNRAFLGWSLNEANDPVTGVDGILSVYAQPQDSTFYAKYVTVFEFSKLNDGEPGAGDRYAVTMGEGLRQNLVTEITIPDHYSTGTVVRMEGFTDCSSVTSISIPDSIEIIVGGTENEKFGGFRNLRSITVYDANTVDPVYFSEDGILYSTNYETGKIEVVCCPRAKSGEVLIPENVNVIAQGAFYFSTVSKVTIAGNLDEIHIHAFYDCSSITAIEFSDGVARPNPLTIVNDAIVGCHYLREITLPANLSAVTATTFEDLDGLVAFKVVGNGEYSAVDGYLCKTYQGNLKELIAAPAAKEISDNGEVGTFRVPDGIASIGDSVFYKNEHITKIIIPNTVQHIGKKAFGRVTSLESISFEEGGQAALAIDEMAFYSGSKDDGTDMNTNSHVTELTLPSNLQTIEKNAFGRFSKLKTVTINADSTKFTGFSLADNAFVGIDGNTAYVEVVNVCAKCKDFTVGSVFGGKVKAVNIDPANPNFKSVGGVVYDTEMTEIKFFPKEYVGPNGDGSFTVPDGMTAIAAQMFANVTTLTSVTIPASVTEIGASAFEGCRNLKSVTFLEPEVSDNTEIHIGARAFFNCYALQQIKLPSRLYSLGMSTFCNCSALTSIELPAGLADIDVNADRYDLFNGCDSLASVTVAAGNTHFSTGDKGDVLYRLESFKLSPDREAERVENILLFVLPNASGTITVPGTVRTVAKYAFKDIPHVTEVIFENAVPRYDATTGDLDTTEYKFNAQAFEGQNSNELMDEYGQYNTSVKKIVLPQGLKEMVENMIYDYEGLESLTIPNTVTRIDAKAINGSWGITSLTFEGGGEDPLTIEGHNEYISSGTTGYWSLFGYTAEGGADATNKTLKLDSVVLPSRIANLGQDALYNSPVKSVTFENGKLSGELVIGDSAFAKCVNLTNFVIPEGTVSIEKNAFNRVNFSEIAFPATLTKIGASAFSSVNVTAMQEKLVIPASVTEIGDYAFQKLANVKSVDLSAATGLEKIGSLTFSEMNDLESVVFTSADAATPAALAEGDTALAALAIGNSAFASNPHLTSISLPANLSTLGTNVFEKCYALTDVTFETYKEGDNAGKSDLKSIGANAFASTGLVHISLPESTAEELKLNKNLFQLCPNLTEVYLPASVKTLNSAFAGCASLQTVMVAEDSPFKTGDLPALYDSTGSILFVYKALDGTLTISGTQIGEGAFAGQADLKKVIITPTVNSIGNNAFKDCINLEEVEFAPGSGLTTLGKNAFMNCYALKSVNLEVCTHLTALPDGDSTSASLFYHCRSLKSIKLPSSITLVGTYSFANSGLESVDLSACKALTTCNQSVFYNCAELTDVKLPGSITKFSTQTFYGCSSLVSIDLSYLRVTSMPDTTFQHCTSLKEVYLPLGVTALGKQMFSGCTALESIDLSIYPQLHSLANNIFENCTNLTDVVLPSGLTTIPQSTFSGCSVLKTIDLSGYTNLKTFGTSVFQNCTNLQRVKLPDGFNFLNTGTFNGCTALKSIDFSNTSIVHIGKAAGAAQSGNYEQTKLNVFQNCTNLETVRFPAGLKSIGHYTFDGATNLKEVYIGDGAANDLSSLESFHRGVFVNSGIPNVILSADSTFTTAASTSSAFYGTFENCTRLKSVEFKDAASLTTIPQYMFKGCSNLQDIDFSEMTSLNYLGEHAFENCTSLQGVDLSNTKLTRFSTSATTDVTYSRDSYVFAGCTELRSVTLPDGFAQIGGYAFQNCTSLESIENFDVAALTHIGRYAFENCPAIKGNIELNTSIAVLGENAFLGCTGITGFHLAGPTGKVYVGSYANFYLYTEGGLLFAKRDSGDTRVITAYSDEAVTDDGTLKLPNGFILYNYSFANFQVEGVKKLDLSALDFTKVPTYAFQNASFEEIILPATVTSIDTYAFQGSLVKKVNLPEGLTSIANNAFQGSSIESINLPASLTSIGKAAFADTAHLKTVTSSYSADGTAATITITAGTSSTNASNMGAFTNSAVESIGFLSRLKEITGYTFYGTGLTELTIPENITSVGNDSFGRSKLQSVTFEGNPTIGLRIFQHCTDLKAVDFGPCTTTNTNEFSDTGFETFTVPNSLTTLANNLFDGSLLLEKVTFAEDYSGTIGQTAFKGCEKLTDVTLPKEFHSTEATVTKLSSTLFQNCIALEHIELPQNITEIGSSTFAGCTALTSIVLPESVSLLDNSAFSGCSSLTSVVLPQNLTKIDSNVFKDTALTGEIVVPESVTWIGANAFAGCTSIDRIILSATAFTAQAGGVSINTFDGWTENQQICFRDSRFEVVALCQTAWMYTCNAQVVYNYGAAE